jgi:hypothetical protein
MRTPTPRTTRPSWRRTKRSKKRRKRRKWTPTSRRL